MRDIADTVMAIHDCPRPVLANVDGVAVGAGFGIALAADLIWCSSRARFSLIFAKRGLSLDFGTSWLLPKRIGLHDAKRLALTGEIADGVVLNYLVSPQYNAQAMEQLSQGAARAGRSVDDLDRPQLIVCSMASGDTEAERNEALDSARMLITQYLGQQPHIMKASGVPDSLLDEVKAVLTWPATLEQVKAASRLVPDEVVQMLCAAGTADECRAKVRHYIDNGCTTPILYPLGHDAEMMIDAFSGWEI